MDLGTHAGFILAAYAVSIAVVAGLIVWIVADYRAQKRLLGELDAEGVTRRSAEARKTA